MHHPMVTALSNAEAEGSRRASMGEKEEEGPLKSLISSSLSRQLTLGRGLVGPELGLRTEFGVLGSLSSGSRRGRPLGKKEINQ